MDERPYFCTHCGEAVVGEATFCGECGGRCDPAQTAQDGNLVLTATSAAVSVPPKIGMPAAATNAAKGWLASQQEKKRQNEESRKRQVDEFWARRAEMLAKAQRTCPFPLELRSSPLPGGLQILPDEFVVGAARDWGWSSQKLVLTTHRLIHSQGRLSKDQEVVYLTDVRDVKYHKPLMGFASLAIETAGGNSITGLPAAKNGQQVRNQILQLVHWARQRAQTITIPASPASSPIPTSSKYDQLQKLAELKATGILSETEFEQEKQKILSKL